MSNELGLVSVRSIFNWSSKEIELIGYCILSFERVMFLVTGLLEGKGRDRVLLLGETGGPLAEIVKEEFGEDNNLYIKFDKLVKDRNAIIHAFSFPNINNKNWDRYHLIKGYADKLVDEDFMKTFIEDCFSLFPMLDSKKMLEIIEQENKS